MSATAAPPGAGLACPRCGANLVEGQEWCLSCGDAARTRLAPTPNWRLPIALVAIVAALALLVIAISFVSLTRDDAPVRQTTSAPATTAATAPPTAAAPTTTTTAPGATTPTTTAPGATSTPTAPGATTTP